MSMDAETNERLDELAALISGLQREQNELRRTATGADTAEAPELDPSKLDLPALTDWVHDFLLPTISVRLTTEYRWCAAWWRHPDEILRLEGARRAWYKLAGEPGTGLSVWWRDHMDPCLHELLSTNGTFGGCTTADDGQVEEARHRPNRPMTAIPFPNTSPEGQR